MDQKTSAIASCITVIGWLMVCVDHPENTIICKE
jgi:hypothetical protein